MNIKLSGRWIFPALILLIALFVNRILGFVLIAGYFVFVLWTKRSDLLSQIAIRKYRQGDLDGACAWFAKAAAQGRVGSTTLLSYALVLLKVGDCDAAGSQIERASKEKLSEYNGNVLSAMRGLLEWKLGDPLRAATQLGALAGEFRNTTLFGALGALYIAEGLEADALRFNLAAYDFDPGDSIIADNLAHIRYLRGELEEAEEILDTVIDREPLIPEPYVNKALIHESRGELEEASRLTGRARQCTYSHLSYFSQSEIEDICDRIESKADDG